jgi:subtilisin family serine protease
MIANSSSSGTHGLGAGFESQVGTPHTTGRYVVVFEEGASLADTLGATAGSSNVADSRDFESQAMDMDATEGADATVFSELGIAVVSVDPERVGRMQTSEAAHGAIMSVSPELIHHVLDAPSDYVLGYRDGVSDLTGRMGDDDAAAAERGARASASPTFADDDESTWGIRATRALTATKTGEGIRIAVLDTGLDSTHPDFVGRNITAKSFIPGASPHDGHGHGTHCIGTACGPKAPTGSRRYGVAYEAEIFVGKVLSDEGSGSDAGILAAINWAVANECPVISMSLGADIARPHPPYNQAGRRALAAGSLIIAAAGNNANRPGDKGFVGAPANSPDIMAVAAVDSQLRIAPFSARSLPGRGGQVDIAGPGVAVYSTWPMPTRYHTISGTSMATPHVAGLAALWAQATERRGLALWATLDKESRRLGLPSLDVGSGLGLAGG